MSMYHDTYSPYPIFPVPMFSSSSLQRYVNVDTAILEMMDTMLHRRHANVVKMFR